MEIDEKINNQMREACLKWTVEEIQKDIKEGRLYGITMLEDKSLYIFFVAARPRAGANGIPMYLHFIIDKDHGSYSKFLSITGPLKPGETKSFDEPLGSDELWCSQSMRNIFKSRCILSAEYLDTGKVRVIFRVALDKSWLNEEFTFDSEPGAEILKLCGLQRPGDKVYYEEAQQKLDHFLKTGDYGEI